MTEALTYNRRLGLTPEFIKVIQEIVGAETDGVWGLQTISRLKSWQRRQDLSADGKFGPRTRDAFDAHREKLYRFKLIALTPQHPVPKATWRHDTDRKTGKPLDRGYYRWPMDYLKADKHLAALTSTLSLIALWVRLLAGFNGKTVHRGFDSFITLDGSSCGFDHMWSQYLPDRIAELAQLHPGVCSWAWGREAASALLDPDFLRLRLGVRRGKHARAEWPSVWRWANYEWFVAGWFEIARHPDVLRFWIDESANKLRDALTTCKQRGWRATDETLVLVARASNSYGVGGFRSQIDAYARKHPELIADPQRLIRAFYDDPDEYDHPRRDDLILKTFGDGVVDFEDLDADDLNWAAPIVRIDGTIPRWVALKPCFGGG